MIRSRLWIYAAWSAVSLAPLAVQAARCWQFSASSSPAPIESSQAAAIEAGAPISDALLASMTSRELFASSSPEATSSGARSTTACGVRWQSWLRAQDALMDLVYGQSLPSLAARVRLLDARRERLEQSGGDSVLLAVVRSELALWQAVQDSHALTTTAAEAIAAKDYRGTIQLCRDQSVKAAPYANAAAASLFAEDTRRINDLLHQSLLAVDYESIPAGTPEEKIAALDRFLSLHKQDPSAEAQPVLEQALAEMENLQGRQAIGQFLKAPPADLAARLHQAVELLHQYPDAASRRVLGGAAGRWLADFLADRPIDNAGGIAETVTKTGRYVLGLYEPAKAKDTFSYWADPAQKDAQQPIQVSLSQLQGPPQAPLFATTVDALNQKLAVVRKSPLVETCWNDLATTCDQLERQTAAGRAAAVQARGVSPASYAPRYAQLSFADVAAASRAILGNFNDLRTLLTPPELSAQAQR